MECDNLNSEEEEEEEEEVLLLGLNKACVADIRQTVSFAKEAGLNFIATSLLHPRRRRSAVAAGTLDASSTVLSRSDLQIDSRDWSRYVIGLISDHIDLDNIAENVRVDSELMLREEFDYALYLGLNAVVLPMPARPLTAPHQPMNLARSVCSLLGLADIGGEAATSTMLLWLRVPFFASEAGEGLDGLDAFRIVRRMTFYSSRLGLCVEMRRSASGAGAVEQMSLAVRRWLCEPVRYLVLHADLFEPIIASCDIKKRKKTSTGGGRVPSSLQMLQMLPEYEECVLQLMSLRGLHIGVSGAGEGEEAMPYLQALAALWERYKEAQVRAQALASSDLRHYQSFVRDYRDSLRLPLQPLQNNLECNTYRVMEMDPVKYSKYAEAIASAMGDLCAIKGLGGRRKKKGSGDAGSSGEVLVIAVGAGRGFLADSALRSARLLNIGVRVVIIEKNKNAVMTLRGRSREEWGGEVKVIHADARDVRLADLGEAFAPGADLLLSELLGSFGDNELSPDIIDTVLSNGLLHSVHGISIPSAYTSYIAPLYAPALHSAARQFLPGDSSSKSLEQLYVVHMTNVDVLAEARPLFHFEHRGGNSSNGDGNKYRTVTFSKEDIAQKCSSSTASGSVEVTGLHTSFECTLYKDVTFSTVPETHSVGMSSWFPGYLPLRIPLVVSLHNNGLVSVSVWRRVDKQRLWYEWCVAISGAAHGSGGGAVVTEMSNANGRSYFVGK